MSKEWKTIPTINDTPKTKEAQVCTKSYKSMMDKVITYTGSKEEIEKKIKQHQEETFAKQTFEEDKLLDAFAKKKLKSKAAIKKAIGLTKKRNEAGKKKEKAAKQPVNAPVEGQDAVDSSRANAEA
jgi:hypothetical protein